MQTRPGSGSAYAESLTTTDYSHNFRYLSHTSQISGIGRTLPPISAEMFFDIM